MQFLNNVLLGDPVPQRVCFSYNLPIRILWLCVKRETDFSQGTAREQQTQNMLATVAATQVPLEGKQHRGLLQGMIIE